MRKKETDQTRSSPSSLLPHSLPLNNSDAVALVGHRGFGSVGFGVGVRLLLELGGRCGDAGGARRRARRP